LRKFEIGLQKALDIAILMYIIRQRCREQKTTAN